MDPYKIIADLAGELAETRAELAETQTQIATLQEDLRVQRALALAPVPALQDSIARNHTPRPTLSLVKDPLSDTAEAELDGLKASEKFMALPKQVREVIRAIVSAYPSYISGEDIISRLTSIRDFNSPPSTRMIPVRITQMRKVFGQDCVYVARGEGWRAGQRLLEIFGKRVDLDGESAADLQLSRPRSNA